LKCKSSNGGGDGDRNGGNGTKRGDDARKEWDSAWEFEGIVK